MVRLLLRSLLVAVLGSAAFGPAPLSAALPAGVCSADAATLCLDDLAGDQRYQARITYHTAQGGGLSGGAHAVSLAPAGLTRGGAFWFFSPDNPEVLVKLLDACTLNQHHWLFVSATTNVGYDLVVADTWTGTAKTYSNADQHPAAAVQDITAFDCANPCGSPGAAARVGSFTASAANPVTGSPETFSWTVGGAGPFAQSLSGTELASVTLNGSDRSFSFAPQVAGPHTATLTVTGRCGSDSRAVSYSVQQSCATPHIDSFTTNYAYGYSSFCAGDSATLSWQTSGSGDVSISPGIGAVGPIGSVNVPATATTTYTITKSAACGSDSAMVNLQVAVPVAIQYFTVDEPITCGGQTSFRWDIEGDGVQYWLETETTFTSFGGSGSGPQTHDYHPSLNTCGSGFEATLNAWGTCPHSEQKQIMVNVGPCAPHQCN